MLPDKVSPDKATITGALKSIKQLSNASLATMRLKINAGWPCKDVEGFDKVNHLFDDDGKVIHALIEDAFSIEVNQRVKNGQFEIEQTGKGE